MSDETTETRVVNTVYARVEKVICPHCECDVGGWVGLDPRLRSNVHECDECDGKFRIASDAEVRLV